MKNEILRLHDLNSYCLLDTDKDSLFDDLVALAANICECPIAGVSLVDIERVWFKSTLGMDVGEVPRMGSFCTRVLHSDGIFEIQDTKTDEAFCAQPAVVDKGIRFYAGAPLVSPLGYKLGALCVMDYEPRTLSEGQKRSLLSLSHQIVSLMELKKSYHQILVQQDLLSRKTAMEALGEMTSSICHEINNPLTILKGLSLMMRDKIAPSEILRDDFNVLDHTINRIADSIRELSGFVNEARKKKAS